MATVTIENLKSILHLDFDIPLGGVHVLSGINGCGKTTLLTCLERLANPYAFQRHFKTSGTAQFDNFRSSQITYSHNGLAVKYIYRNTRWSPNPRANASILSTLGFNQVVYLTSSGERFYVQNEELDTRYITAAPQFFKDSMNEIFQTAKYNDLRRVKLTGRGRGNGRWNYGFILPTTSQGGQNRYYTEKNFSLGEILILNALFELNSATNNSLVLVDEVELALHPKVQVKFLQFLQNIAQLKNLTIIISTHSTSLIKSAPKLIHLERQANGSIVVDYDCFPALALQNVAVEEEIQPDVAFFVEDLVAKNVLEELLNYYFRHLFAGRRPIIKVLPIAGWVETMKFTIASSGYLTPRNTSSYAFLDIDAQATIQQFQGNPNRSIAEQEILNTYNANLAKIKFLPITPELGIVTLLRTNPNTHIAPLQTFFSAPFDISQIIIDEQNRGLVYSNNQRKEAKTRMDYYIERIKQSTNRDINQVKSMIAQYYVSIYGPANHGLLLGLFNPIFV
jgi:ABC-type cobalamin/Fe3+-siderophores transport system ATPase subunit